MPFSSSLKRSGGAFDHAQSKYRLEEIEKQLSSPDAWNAPEKLTPVLREKSQLENSVARLDALRQAKDDMLGLSNWKNRPEFWKLCWKRPKSACCFQQKKTSTLPFLKFIPVPEARKHRTGRKCCCACMCAGRKAMNLKPNTLTILTETKPASKA
jgi:hypothetical protein